MISGCFHEFYILTSNISNNIQLLSNYHLALTSLKTRLIHSTLNMNGKKVLTYGTNNRELVVAIYVSKDHSFSSFTKELIDFLAFFTFWQENSLLYMQINFQIRIDDERNNVARYFVH